VDTADHSTVAPSLPPEAKTALGTGGALLTFKVSESEA
jgi:hypothetical protein